MIPKILHQCHLGDPMSDQVRGWVRSVGAHHPDWSHIIWSEIMLCEIGFEAPRAQLAELGSWAAVTNRIRLQLLLRFGGVWLDSDIEAVDSLDRLPLDEYRAFAAPQDG